MYRRNPRYYFLSQFSSTTQGHESKRTKAKTFVFVEALKRAAWDVLTMGCFNFFLKFFFGGVSLVRPCCLPFTWPLNSWKACSARCKSAVAKTRLSRRTSSNASCCSLNVASILCRDARLEYRIASVTVVQTAHVSC